VLLRCTVNGACPTPYVPTGLDAFDGPVFEAAQELPQKSESGYTINLAQAVLVRGEQELLMEPIPSILVSIKPMLIEGKMKNRGTPVRKDSTTWQKLVSYYRACQECAE
jgi:hypothetical protein